MLAALLTPEYLPFTAAFVLMLAVGLVEALGFGLGEIEVEGGTLDWLGIGAGVPVLVWVTSLLAGFTVAGLVFQQAATAVTGAPLHPALASGGALVVGGLVNRSFVKLLARLLPAYESTVIDTEDLVMRRGTILEGVARRGVPARAKVVDHHGQAHFILVEPQYDGDTIATGQTALLVRRDGTLFYGLPDAPALSPL